MTVYQNFRPLKEGIPRISGAINQSLKGYARASAQRVQQNAQDLLGHDQPFWQPITESTRQQRQENQDGGPLLDTGALRDSIIVVVRRDETTRDSAAIEYAVGVSDSAEGTRPNGQPYKIADAAFVLEFGGAGIGDSVVPPRPFLRTALLMERAHFKENVRASLKEAVDKALERGGPVVGYHDTVNTE